MSVMIQDDKDRYVYCKVTMHLELYKLQDEKQNKIVTGSMNLPQYDDLLSLPRETSKRGCQKTSQT